MAAKLLRIAATKEADVISRRIFRAVSMVAVLAALLLVYQVHPVAGWTTLTALGFGTFVVRRHKQSAVIAR